MLKEVRAALETGLMLYMYVLLLCRIFSLDQGKSELTNILVRQDLRYKDYHLAVRPDRKANAISITSTHENAKKHVRGGSKGSKASVASVEEMQVDGLKPGMREVESVKEFGKIMEERGVWEWWRKGMGYEKAEGVI